METFTFIILFDNLCKKENKVLVALDGFIV